MRALKAIPSFQEEEKFLTFLQFSYLSVDFLTHSSSLLFPPCSLSPHLRMSVQSMPMMMVWFPLRMSVEPTLTSLTPPS